MSRRIRGLGAAALAGVAALGSMAAGACAPEAGPTVRLALEETLGGADTSGYARALEPVPLHFPEDHGPHPDFRTEWWYATGNLEANDGRRFGYQLTLFRNALAPTAGEAPSSWATNQVYMAHFAVTDARAGTFRARERFSRGALGLAGARAVPFRVWLEDWEIRSAGDSATFPLRLRAKDGETAVDLWLDQGKPPVLHGDAGFSRKGSEPGDASYYYSYTRMPTRGCVVVNGDTVRVTGTSWLDREWSTSGLGEGRVGWDWFALQLDDGEDLMAYKLRTSGGSAAPFSEGTLVDPRGGTTRLAWGEDIRMVEQSRWVAPDGVATYPSGWEILIPARGLSLEVHPVVADQELRLAFRYWEGAVDVSGTGPTGPVHGRGYVELTGYARDGRVR